MKHVGEIKGFFVYGYSRGDTEPNKRPYMGVLNLTSMLHWVAWAAAQQEVSDAKNEAEKGAAQRAN